MSKLIQLSKLAKQQVKKTYRKVGSGKNGKERIYESDPQCRMIRYRHIDHSYYGGSYEKETHEFYLSFPYVAYFIRKNLMAVAFRKKPMAKVEDYSTYYYPLLPNIGRGNVVCQRRGKYNSDEEMIDEFWSSLFQNDHNDDVHDGLVYLKRTFGKSIVESFKDWDEMTREDPNVIMDIPWHEPSRGNRPNIKLLTDSIWNTFG